MTNKKFLDYAASVTGAEYTVYSVNHNGMSKGISVTGKKAYQCLDDYETYEIGSVIEPFGHLFKTVSDIIQRGIRL